MVVEFHELLKRVFQDFNNVFGFMALGITVICIPQLVSFFNELLNPSSPFRFIRNMVRFAHFFFYMTLTAFINSKVMESSTIFILIFTKVSWMRNISFKSNTLLDRHFISLDFKTGKLCNTLFSSVEYFTCRNHERLNGYLRIGSLQNHNRNRWLGNSCYKSSFT